MKRYHRIILLLGYSALIITRAPNLLIHPRFWAEEGSLYFANAHNNPWHIAFLTPHLGYYSFLHNASSLLAQLPPLQYAPFVTTYMALLIQIIPCYIILWGNSYCWNTVPKKVISCLFILFCPSATGEIFLNVTNSHFYLSLITFLILLEPVDDISNLKHSLQLVLLAIAGLTSAISTFLTPVFLFSAIKEKKRARFVQTIILCLCLIVQIVAFGYETMSGENVSGRFHALSFNKFYYYFFKFGIVTPLFGNMGYPFIPKSYYDLFAILAILSISYFIAINMFFNKKFTGIDQIAFKSITSYFILIVLSLILSVEGEGGLRYAYAPSIMLMFFFFSTSLYDGKVIRTLACLFIIISLTCGTVLYWNYMKIFNFYKQWPDWVTEVETWQKDPGRSIKIWPQQMGRIYKKNWEIFLIGK